MEPKPALSYGGSRDRYRFHYLSNWKAMRLYAFRHYGKSWRLVFECVTRYVYNIEVDIDLCVHGAYNPHESDIMHCIRAGVQISSQVEKNTLRAKRLGALGPHIDVYQWNTLLELHDYKCSDCGGDGDGSPLEIGHKIPLSKGGSNWICNITPQCFHCNRRQYDGFHDKATFSLFDMVPHQDRLFLSEK